MIQKYSVLTIVLITFIFSGCVSKKKFVEMQNGRLRAENRAQQLDEENKAKAARIETMVADFETMKNELLLNNAIKEQLIDSLNGTVFKLNESLASQKETLQRTSSDLTFQQSRLNDTLEQKERNIANLKKEMTRLENEVTEKDNSIEQKNFDIGKLKDEATELNGKIQSGDKKIADLQSQLEKLKTQITNLQKQSSDKDETIQRLENNVKLLKKELGQ